jgi:virginiamycin B lyase
MSKTQLLRLGSSLALAASAAVIFGCSSSGTPNTLPAGGGAGWGPPSGLRLAKERVTIAQFADLPTYSSYYGPSAIASGPKRSLWVTDDIDQDFGECAVARIATSGKLIKAYYYGGVTSEGASFADITAGPDGALWITDSYNAQILRMSPDGTFTGFSLGGYSPQNITAGPDKALWFTENTDGSTIGRITTKGVITKYTAQGDVEDIAAGPDGALWFTEFTGNAIGRITAGGKITEYSKNLDPSSAPTGIAAGPDGNMWFVESAANLTGRVSLP